MSTEWLSNGLFVQGKRKESFPAGLPSYKGGALREPWPLYGLDNPLARELTKATDKWFNYWYIADVSYSLNVCPDLTLAKKYVNCCRRLINSDIRVLLCKSKRTFPKMSDVDIVEIETHVKFLGWDHLSVSFDFSTIAYELSDLSFRTEPFRKNLNENGLFPSFETLAEYVSARDELIKQGQCPDIEVDIELEKIALYEMDIMFFE